MSQIRSYHDLDVWQGGMALVEKCYRLTETFPATERFALSLQLRKASVSIPSNIAEGHNRKRTQAYLNHLSIAGGSLAEIETLIELARRLHYITDGAAADAFELAGQLGRQLTGLMRSLERKRLGSLATSLLYCVLGLATGAVVF